MKRILLPLLGAGLLALNACNSDTKTSDTSSTGSATPESSATDSSSMSAPADSSKSGAMASPGDSTQQGSAAADVNGPTAPHATDAEFMKSAAHSDQNEMQLSKMALTKDVSPATKTLANKMIADHTKSTANLKPIAAKAGVALPTDMDAEHKAMAPQMEKLAGKAFETKYLSQMQTDHQKTANTLKAHEQMTKSGPLRSWIGTTLPVVEQHLSMANKDAGMKM